MLAAKNAALRNGIRCMRSGPGVPVSVARHPPHGLTAVCESGEMKDAPILKLEAVE